MNIIRLLTTVPRMRLQMVMDKKFRVLEDTIDTVNREKKRAIKHGTTSLISLHDATLYLLLFNADLTVLLHQLVVEQTGIRRKVISKHIISLIYEIFDDFNHVFGKRVHEALSCLPNSDLHKDSFSQLSKELKDWRTAHEADFKIVRDTIGAHRDHDGERQLKILNNINDREIERLAKELDRWFSRVCNFLADSAKAYTYSPQMLKEVCEKLERDRKQSTPS